MGLFGVKTAYLGAELHNNVGRTPLQHSILTKIGADS